MAYLLLLAQHLLGDSLELVIAALDNLDSACPCHREVHLGSLKPPSRYAAKNNLHFFHAAAGTTTMLSYTVNQLMNLNSFFTPPCTAVIKQRGLLRRPRYIHRSSRRKFVCSQTSPTIPALWSATRTVAPRIRHQSAVSYWIGSLDVSMATPLSELNGKRGVDSSLLRPVQRLAASSSSKILLLNS